MKGYSVGRGVACCGLVTTLLSCWRIRRILHFIVLNDVFQGDPVRRWSQDP
jgi:hypothetical protein